MRELLVDDFELVEVSTQPEMAAYANADAERAGSHPTVILVTNCRTSTASR